MNHSADVIDIDAARSDVSRHKHRQLAFGKPLQCPFTRLLWQVTVDRRRLHSKVFEVLRDPVTRTLGLTKHEQLRDPSTNRFDDLVLVHVMHGEEKVMHRADRVGRLVDRHLDRIFEVVLDQMADIAVERCREQHRLIPARAMTQDPLDLWRKAVIGHPVGLIETHDLTRAKIDLVRLQQVDQSKRRGDDQLNALVEFLDLGVPAGTAVHGEHPHTGMSSDRFQHLGNLHRQFTRRH